MTTLWLTGLPGAGKTTLARAVAAHLVAAGRAAVARFVEVHVSTPLAVCRARDPKSLYARADAGALTGLTGVDAPYEEPEAPALRLDTSALDVAACVVRLTRLVPRDHAEGASSG